MAEDKLWKMGNREPSPFVRDLEMARRKAAQHRKGSAEAWQDFAALRDLIPEAVRRLLILEDEREELTERLTIDPPPEDVPNEVMTTLCEETIAGALAHIAHDATMKGWPSETVYRAMIKWGEYMIEFEREALGKGNR